MSKTHAPTKARKQKDRPNNKKGTKENPRETVYPEQSGQSSKGDAYNGDDKHGPMEEEIVEQERS